MLNLPANSKQHLIIFTRYPEAGKTKTRLIPVLGNVGAANLQREMTEHTIDFLQKSLNYPSPTLPDVLGREQDFKFPPFIRED